MACILGIDLGTSSIKAMLLDEEKGVIGTSARSYTVNIPEERIRRAGSTDVVGILKRSSEKPERNIQQ